MELKNTITEILKFTRGFQLKIGASRKESANRKIGQLKIFSTRSRKKKVRKNEQNVIDLWDTIKCTNTQCDNGSLRRRGETERREDHLKK